MELNTMFDGQGPLISDKVLIVFQWIIFSIVCQSIVIFGIITNIINIICFVKQGFKDSVNVSLLGLAVSDTGCLTTLIWTNLCFTPAFSSLDLPFEAIEFQYLISGTPHVTFTRVTAWITALITLERCLCIAAPLKVKSIVTPKRAAVIIVCVFVILIFSVTPVYIVNQLSLKFFADRNKTLLGITFTENRGQVERISFAVNNAFVPFSAFIVIIICTATLVITLQNTAKWRQKSATSVQADNVSTRNRKVAKMVVMISVLFITCFILMSTMYLVMTVEKGISIDGRHRCVGVILAGLGLLLESVNSASNVFIYYKMSSKYKTIFRQLFCLVSACTVKD